MVFRKILQYAHLCGTQSFDHCITNQCRKPKHYFKELFVSLVIDNWTSVGRHSFLMLSAQYVTARFDFDRLLGSVSSSNREPNDELFVVRSVTESMLAATRETAADCHPLCILLQAVSLMYFSLPSTRRFNTNKLSHSIH